MFLVEFQSEKIVFQQEAAKEEADAFTYIYSSFIRSSLQIFIEHLLPQLDLYTDGRYYIKKDFRGTICFSGVESALSPSLPCLQYSSCMLWNLWT